MSKKEPKNSLVFDAFVTDVLEDFAYLENSDDEYLSYLMSYLYHNVLPRYFVESGKTQRQKLQSYRDTIDGGDDEKIHRYLSAGIQQFVSLYDTKGGF
jgi:hypothetical protein